MYKTKFLRSEGHVSYFIACVAALLKELPLQNLLSISATFVLLETSLGKIYTSVCFRCVSVLPLRTKKKKLD